MSSEEATPGLPSGSDRGTKVAVTSAIGLGLGLIVAALIALGQTPFTFTKAATVICPQSDCFSVGIGIEHFNQTFGCYLYNIRIGCA